MELYQKFRAMSIDFANLGLIPGEEKSNYFCTPVGAEVIGWTGVDGVHFCYVRGFGETVFSVNPMNLPGEYVHPVAENFEDFLRLILACRGTAAIEQMFAWTEAAFEAYLRQDAPDIPRQTALGAVSDAFRLEAMECPFDYVRRLQQSFDLTRLRFPEDYDEWAPPVTKPQPWKVTFAGSFDHHAGQGGREIPINKVFSWGDTLWHIPAVYACAEGLVVDVLAEADLQAVTAFTQKVAQVEGQGSVDNDVLEPLSAENPLEHDFSLSISLNGVVLDHCELESRYYIPLSYMEPGTNCDASAKIVVGRYGLDTGKPWSLYRGKFFWKTKKKPSIRSLAITFIPGKKVISGPVFEAVSQGDEMTFVHPLTGLEHRIRAEILERVAVDIPAGVLPGATLPDRYWRMRYTLVPDIPESKLLIRDLIPGDEPRYTMENDTGFSSSEAAAIGVIGGADGPTSVFLAAPGVERGRWANGSVRFDLTERAKWKLDFLEKTLPDLTVKLI